jgi:AcrR family transcriptional regulator
MKRTEKSIKKRDEIVDRVISLLGELNFRDATVRRICEAANISVGTFYHYFQEKNDLVSEILGRIDRYLSEQVLPGLNSCDEMENLAEFGRGFARYTNSVGSATGSIISTADFPLPDSQEKMRAEQERPLYTIPRGILEKARQKGQVPQDLDPRETADQLIVCLRGHSLEWSRRNRVYNIEEKISHFMDLFIRIVKK